MDGWNRFQADFGVFRASVPGAWYLTHLLKLSFSNCVFLSTSPFCVAALIWKHHQQQEYQQSLESPAVARRPRGKYE